MLELEPTDHSLQPCASNIPAGRATGHKTSCPVISNPGPGMRRGFPGRVSGLLLALLTMFVINIVAVSPALATQAPGIASCLAADESGNGDKKETGEGGNGGTTTSTPAPEPDEEDCD